jgi:hypothetical protein
MNDTEQIMRMVLEDEELRKAYGYDLEEVLKMDIFEARDSDNAVVAAVARVVGAVNKNLDPTKKKEIYQKMFNYLNTRLLS